MGYRTLAYYVKSWVQCNPHTHQNREIFIDLYVWLNKLPYLQEHACGTDEEKKGLEKHSESREFRDIIIINKRNGLSISKCKKKIFLWNDSTDTIPQSWNI